MNIKKTTSGKRFDYDAAKSICGIGWKRDQDRGSTLYQTASGNFVTLHWSRWQGEGDRWEETDRDGAKAIAIDNLPWGEAVQLFPELEDEFKEDL
jgi:hypothetical protein